MVISPEVHEAADELRAAIGKQILRRSPLPDETIDSAEALRIGLISRIAPAEALLEQARAIAERIAANAPLAALPLVVIFMFLGRYFIRGLSAGAVK